MIKKLFLQIGSVVTRFFALFHPHINIHFEKVTEKAFNARRAGKLWELMAKKRILGISAY